MSLRVAASASADITNKWELTQRMSCHLKEPEQALTGIFEAAMQHLEIVASTKFESSMKEKIWEAISGPRLKDIRQTFMLQFCDQVLGRLSEEEVAEMLEEHTRTGRVKNTEKIQEAYALCRSSIIDAVRQKALSMSNGLESDLVAAVKREGIQLSEPQKPTTTSSPSRVIESAIPTPPKTSPFAVLINAVETGDLDKVRESLQNGANPDGRVSGQHIVHLACEKGNIDIVCELLDNGAEVNIKSWRWNDTPLHRACVFGHTAVVEELIKRGAMLNIRNSNCWQTPLETAITGKHLACCQLLVGAGATINEVNCAGATPLKAACNTGNYEIVKLLLDAGANPNLSSGMTPLYQAVTSPAILQLMLDRGAQVNKPNGPRAQGQASKYPLHAAALFGYDDSVRVLLRAGAYPKVRDDEDKTPVELARWQLDNQRTNPCSSRDVTTKMIEKLEKIISMLET